MTRSYRHDVAYGTRLSEGWAVQVKGPAGALIVL
jgi:hypothetical protein